MESVKGFIIDLDGTVYTGQQAISGAIEAVNILKSLHIPFVFLSNRGNYSRAMCREKLNRMGLDVEADRILLSSTVTAAFLQKHYPGEAVWPFGDPGLEEELRSHNVVIANEPEEAKWLVITLHESLTYEDLNKAFRAVRHGARIIATNEDKMFPTEQGDSIDVAGMIGAIVHATGVEVSHVMGKPSAMMAGAALTVLGLEPSECIVVGDSMTSDIGLGSKHGMKTALVLTGNATQQDVAHAQQQPDYVSDDLLQLVHAYTAACGYR
ncbi:HAD-IIA family hydrolase [Paenibacillus camelliae]|uniref:HAD-IIA family hydrolase n=1 Tax=Paenibacillus camelliae TaxID=512410 RepID=UPI00203F360B|nr:HAD-IIA family hydrolase [Paenibacillus camelliae]MCM3633284.1 HAD-IIA family hydrolase [Paenibacillus camelliae]